MIEPAWQKLSSKGRLGWIAVAAVVCLSGLQCFSQRDCKKQSLRSELASHGANEVVVFSDVRTVKQLHGRILDVNGVPINGAVLDIFPATGLAKKVSPERFVIEEKRIRSYGADQAGAYCIDGLPDGEYVLRFGTDSFGFKHTLVKVRIKKSGSGKATDVELWPGT